MKSENFLYGLVIITFSKLTAEVQIDMLNVRNGGLSMEKTTHTKTKKRHKKIINTEGQSELLKQFLAMKPLYSSNEEALLALQKELSDLAAVHGQTIDALLEEAETSPMFKEHHMRATSLARSITRFRLIAKK